ncbi:MAG TPA: hypothetical protein VF435_04365 [Pyrinomonadaceae bacterium]
MKSFKLTAFARNVLALLLFTSALLAAVPVYFAPEGYVVQAECFKAGRPTIKDDETIFCDTTATDRLWCITLVDCPKEGGDVPSGGDS